jgi:hypothetical protein
MPQPSHYDPAQHAPGVVHPALDEPVFRDWINERGPYANRYDVKYAIAPAFSWAQPDPEPLAPSFDVGVITRYKMAGPAPYVGRPFCYWWWVGVDQLGRAICADDVHLKHLVSDWEWMMYES